MREKGGGCGWMTRVFGKAFALPLDFASDTITVYMAGAAGKGHGGEREQAGRHGTDGTGQTGYGRIEGARTRR